MLIQKGDATGVNAQAFPDAVAQNKTETVASARGTSWPFTEIKMSALRGSST